MAGTQPAFPVILASRAFISLHFSVLAFISLHFGLVGLHFLAFWPSGPSFPCILALWAFISLHFGLVGLHFLAFLPFRGQLLGSSPQVAKNGLFAQRPYNGFISAVTGTILQFLAFWAFISLHFGLVGFHFLAFWPRGPSFPCIFAFSGSASGVLPTSCQKLPVCPTSLQWIYQRRDRLHFAVFSLLGVHFLAFWPCGPSFPSILAFWAFISLHFGLVGLHFLAFWPFRLSFPCMLALWAFIPCNFLGRQLRRSRQRADPSRCPISESFCLMCPPLDRGARGVDNPKPVKVKMRVERQRGWDLTASARARRLRPLGRGAPLPVDTLNPKFPPRPA